MQQDQVRAEVTTFIKTNFIFSDNKSLGADESLLGTGIMDSTGVLELISFLEGQYKIAFADNELVADNFDSVNKIVAFITRKLAGGAV
jgi:acyl carrier protein